MNRRIVGFIVLCVVCVAGAVGYVVVADRKATQAAPPGASKSPQQNQAALAAVAAKEHVMFRSTSIGTAGRVGEAAITALDRPVFTDLRCERVYFAGGRGLCLQADRGAITTYKVVFFDQQFKSLHTDGLAGLPSRARVSDDGRYGATTTFVYGDSYAGNTFSTRTELYDMRSAKSLGDLESFTSTKDGKVIDAVDKNLWGVTFAADSNTYYATLSTGGHYYLVRGDVAARRMTVLRDGVECPSISPDGTRLAFKKRFSGPLGRTEWRLSVLDLKTLVDHPLAETRSVDDQAEWLDNSTVLYSIPHAQSGSASQDTWQVPADGSGQPAKFLPDGYSTTVVAPVPGAQQP